MRSEEFATWLDKFGEAWRTNDPATIGNLVADDFRWYGGPFSEFFSDRKILVDHWISVANSHSRVQPSYEVLSVSDDIGICRHRVTYVEHRSAVVTGDGIFAVRLDEQGRCTEFREWWLSSQEILPDYAQPQE